MVHECGYCNPIGYSSIDPWTQKVTSAQTENIKKNFASAKPMTQEPLAVRASVSADATEGASSLERSKCITVTAVNVIPYYTGYSRIDNAITDALKGKSQELKDNVYDIIWTDLLRSNVHGLDESDRKALISLGVEKAQYLADNFMDDKAKSSFMEAMRSIAKIGMEGKRVGCSMEYNVKHAIQVDGDGYVHDSNLDAYLYAMEKSEPKAFETYKKLQGSSQNDIEAAFFALRWAMANLNLVEANRPGYQKQQDEKYERLQSVKLDQTFSGSDTSSKEKFLASIAQKLAAQNLNTDFFLKQIAKMTQTPGVYLLGRMRSLSAKA